MLCPMCEVSCPHNARQRRRLQRGTGQTWRRRGYRRAYTEREGWENGAIVGLIVTHEYGAVLPTTLTAARSSSLV